jgi:ATP-dependent Lon protease
MDAAHKALEENHYGMREVKDDILELIAVGKLNGTLKGKSLLLVGAPGLGKTTLAYSIAKALNRKFESIALGGVTDSSVLKGHKRTYIGAYSGKIISALKSCKTSDPVILLDEIDKMGWSQQGNPAA